MFKYKIEDHLELRLFEYSNGKALFKLIEKNRPYLRAWLGWVDKNTTLSDTNEFIKFTKSSLVNGQGVKAGIWYKENLIGLIDHHDVNRNAMSLNIGYWLDRDFQGQGIMTKCCVSMTNYAFELGMNKVEIRCAEQNLASRGIPERLGFAEEGKLRCAEFLYDHYVDHIVYGMLRTEWTHWK